MKRPIILLTLIICSTAVLATNTPQNTSISLDQAIVKVLERSPLLVSATYEARAAAARIKQARLKKPLTINIDLENFAGSGNAHGSDLMESTLSLGSVLEFGDKPKLRGELAQHQSFLLQNQHDIQRLDLLADVTRRFIHIVANQHRLIIARDALQLTQRMIKSIEHRVRVGKSSDAELRLGQIALARSKMELKHVTHELKSARVKLSTLWGETQPTFDKAHAALFNLQEITQLPHLEKLLAHNPDLVHFATKQRLTEARLRLAKAQRRPDLNIAGGVRYLESTDDIALVLSASIPLGSSSRAANLIEEAQMETRHDTMAYKQRRLTLYATLFEIYQELHHAAEATKVLHEQIIPHAESALKAYEKGYKLGRYSLNELTNAQKNLLNAKQEVVMAAADYHRLKLEIDRLTGGAKTTGVSL